MKSSAGEKTEAGSVMLPHPEFRLKVTSYEMLSFRNACFLVKITGFEPGKRFIHYPLVSRFRLTRLDSFLQRVVPFSLGIRFADGYWVVAKRMMDR